MDPLAVITTGVVTAVGLAAGVVQVVDYVHKVRNRRGGEPVRAVVDHQHHTADAIIHNLPPRGEFIGRDAEKRSLVEALNSRSHVICVDGIGGVGKTSLVLEIAYQFLAGESGASGEGLEAIIWISCKDVEVKLGALLSTIARVLDYPSVDKGNLSQKKATIHRLLRQLRCLIVFDNFELAQSEEIAAFLLSLPETAKIVLVTRKQIAVSSRAVSLGGFSANESVALMRTEGRHLNIRSVEQADDETLLRLHRATGGVPLAIKWSLGQIKQRGQTVDGLVASLNSARSDVFTTIFATSWDLLTRRSQRALLTLSLLPNPASRRALEAGTALRGQQLNDALGQLVELSLVDTEELDADRRRYRIHPMTRAFASSKFGKGGSSRGANVRRLVLWARQFAEVTSASGWRGYPDLAAEKDNFLHIIHSGFEVDWDVAKDILFAMKWFLWEHGYWPEIIQICDDGMRHAVLNDDGLFAGRYAKEVAWVRCRQGDPHAAAEWADRTRSFWKDAEKSPLDVADMDTLDALLVKGAGDIERARSLLLGSLDVYLAFEDNRIETLRLLTLLGELELHQGNHAGAAQWFSETLTRATRSDQRPAAAWSLANLGEVEFQRGNLAEARSLSVQGLELASGISRYHTTADCALRIAQIDEADGAPESALTHCRLALDRYSRLGIENRTLLMRQMLHRLDPTAE